MISTGQTPRGPRFWIPKRLALTLSTFAVALVALSSCGDGGSEVTTANTNAGGPKVTINSSANTGATVTVANSAANAPAPPAPVAMPPGVREMPLKDIDGKTFRLADYAGKVVVLDLWATWCNPCRYEIPDLNKISTEYGPKGVQVIGLTIEDPETDAEAVAKFVRDIKINYKVGWSQPAFANAIRRSNSIPQTFVIGKDGRLLKYFAGFTLADYPPGVNEAVATPRRMREAVEQALGGT